MSAPRRPLVVLVSLLATAAFPLALAHAQSYDANFAHPAYAVTGTGFSGTPCSDFSERDAKLVNGPFAPGNPTLALHGQPGFAGWIDQTRYRVREDSSDRIPLLWPCNAWPWDWPTGRGAESIVDAYVDTSGIGWSTFIQFAFSWRPDSVHEFHQLTPFGWLTGACTLDIPSIGVSDFAWVDPVSGTCDFGPYWIAQGDVHFTGWASAGAGGSLSEPSAAALVAGAPIRSTFTIDVAGHATSLGAEL